MKVDPRRVRPWVTRLLILAILVQAWLLYRRFGIHEVPSEASRRGAFTVLVDRRPGELHRGHRVRYRAGEEGLGVGRIVALPGDELTLREGWLWVDGSPVVGWDRPGPPPEGPLDEATFLVAEDRLAGEPMEGRRLLRVPKGGIHDRILVVFW